MSAAPGRGLINRLRISMKTRDIRRQLEAAASGRVKTVSIDLGDAEVNPIRILDEMTSSDRPGSPRLVALVEALRRSGVYDTVLDQLAAKDSSRRARGAQLVGALRLEQTVPSLVPLVLARERPVRDAASRALGRIGGLRSASVLLGATRFVDGSPRLLIDLCRAAPDLFLEEAIVRSRDPRTRCSAAIAAGLRGRRTAIEPLTARLANGTRREREVSCRALGWIGAGTSVSAVEAALSDPDRRVRASAARAMRLLRCRVFASVERLPALEAAS